MGAYNHKFISIPGKILDDNETQVKGGWKVLLLNAPVKVKKTGIDEGIGNCTDKDTTNKI